MSATRKDCRELDDIVTRAADPVAFEAWQNRAAAAGWCRNPVRLAGSSSLVDASTGEVVVSFSSAHLPDRVLLKACGHRRATRCPTERGPSPRRAAS